MAAVPACLQEFWCIAFAGTSLRAFKHHFKLADDDNVISAASAATCALRDIKTKYNKHSRARRLAEDLVPAAVELPARFLQDFRTKIGSASAADQEWCKNFFWAPSHSEENAVQLASQRLNALADALCKILIAADPDHVVPGTRLPAGKLRDALSFLGIHLYMMETSCAAVHCTLQTRSPDAAAIKFHPFPPSWDGLPCELEPVETEPDVCLEYRPVCTSGVPYDNPFFHDAAVRHSGALDSARTSLASPGLDAQLRAFRMEETPRGEAGVAPAVGDMLVPTNALKLDLSAHRLQKRDDAYINPFFSARGEGPAKFPDSAHQAA